MSIHNREPMGRLIFKDGREEPIVFYRMFNAQYVEFYTVREAFSYEVMAHEHEMTHIKYSDHKFYEHVVTYENDQWDDMWYVRNDIENIILYEEGWDLNER